MGSNVHLATVSIAHTKNLVVEKHRL